MKFVIGAMLLGTAGAWALGSAWREDSAGRQDVAQLAVAPEVAAAAEAGIPVWAAQYDASRIEFASTISGAPMTGSFGQWDAQIAFDPANLAASRVAVTIDLASARTGDEARDEMLPGSDWFDAGQFPHGTFKADSFRSLGADRYEALGQLSIRGVQRPVTLPFTLAIKGDEATMSGALTLDRRDFGLGKAQFAAVDVVPAAVEVKIALKARRAQGLRADAAGFGQAATADGGAGQSCTYGPYWGDDYRPKPQFAGQTRAPAAKRTNVRLETLADLDTAWSIAFLPDGKMLVTERPGRMRIIDRDGRMGAPIAGLPPIKVIANTGLYDVALDPGFKHNRRLYFGYFAPAKGEAPTVETDRARWTAWMHLSQPERDRQSIGMQRIASARLSKDGTRLEDVKVIAQQAGLDGRIAVGRDGKVYITAGTIAAGDMEVDDLPQRLNYTYGKVLRINRDGTIPRDNPFVGRKGAVPAIYAYGLRDPQGAAINPVTGDLWTVEHGPRGGDELNIIRSGRNYGFPTVSYGRNYSGTFINGGATVLKGTEQPVYFWTPSIAPSGMHFYNGTLFPEWRGNLFVGAMAGKRLMRLVLDGNRVVGEEQMLTDLCEPIRDIEEGPDGALYLLTKGPKSKLLRLTPSRS
ncbi:PQQ-dependent sugar dehydrogenase [Tsuneonella sp. HG222]